MTATGELEHSPCKGCLSQPTCETFNSTGPLSQCSASNYGWLLTRHGQRAPAPNRSRELLAAWDAWKYINEGVDHPACGAAFDRLSELFETVREDETKDSRALSVLCELFDALEDPGIQITSTQKPLCYRVIAALFATRDLLESEQATASASRPLGRLE